MKYKVGDKVKVRSDLVVGSKYGYGAYFTESMAELRGKSVTITSTDSNSYHVDPLWEHWTDDMFEGLEDGKMYASELMELARKEPEKYEGKRYRVVEGSYLWFGADNRDECIIVNGRLTEKNRHSTLSVYADTVLKEIPPESKPVPFMEAVKAYNEGKAVKCSRGCFNHTYTPTIVNGESAGAFSDEYHLAPSAQEILNGEWFIEE